MSALPNRTQILIKDLPFQEKYNLSHSQTDLMAYLVNVIYWAINVEGYFVITTSKIMSDLPAMGQKTIEANLKVLKNLGLIECKIVEVTQWQRKPKLRGVKLTSKGEEYNAKLVLPSQDEEVKRLKSEIKKLKETIKNLTVSESESSTVKEEAKPQPKPSTPTMPPLQAIETFIGDVTKRFGRSSQPICNDVPKWNKETTFYINSYHKLSVITAQNEHKQLKNPLEIQHFWQWLFLHNNRIGDIIDFTKEPTLQALEERFLQQTVKIGEKKQEVYAILPFEDGVKIGVKNEKGKVGFLMDGQTKKEMIFSLKRAQEVLFELLVL